MAKRVKGARKRVAKRKGNGSAICLHRACKVDIQRNLLYDFVEERTNRAGFVMFWMVLQLVMF